MARAEVDARVLERRRRWAGLISEWRDSGSSQAAYCREHGLNANTFNYWKLRAQKMRSGALRKRRAEDVARPVHAEADRDAGRSATFTPVRVVEVQSCVFEVFLRSGRTIRVASDFDEASLRRLIGVLDGANGAC